MFHTAAVYGYIGTSQLRHASRDDVSVLRTDHRGKGERMCKIECRWNFQNDVKQD